MNAQSLTKLVTQIKRKTIYSFCIYIGVINVVIGIVLSWASKGNVGIIQTDKRRSLQCFIFCCFGETEADGMVRNTRQLQGNCYFLRRRVSEKGHSSLLAVSRLNLEVAGLAVGAPLHSLPTCLSISYTLIINILRKKLTVGRTPFALPTLGKLLQTFLGIVNKKITDYYRTLSMQVSLANHFSSQSCCQLTWHLMNGCQHVMLGYKSCAAGKNDLSSIACRSIALPCASIIELCTLLDIFFFSKYPDRLRVE